VKNLSAFENDSSVLRGQRMSGSGDVIIFTKTDSIFKCTKL
jgi:hypothetical protein